MNYDLLKLCVERLEEIGCWPILFCSVSVQKPQDLLEQKFVFAYRSGSSHSNQFANKPWL